MIDERYPIGPFKPKENYTREELESLITQIAALPEQVESATKGLSADQLDTPYRDGGWTVRQVIHHLADSHMNSYIRMKWTLTEDKPLIKAYDEKAWATTKETELDPSLSLAFLKAFHAKWVEMMKLFSEDDLSKEFIHPESKRSVRIDRMIALYAWHGLHHLAHITSLKSKKGWN